jgi:hypothetical protein
MSLDRIAPDASLERGHYHQLATPELDRLNHAEAHYERGRRFRSGISVTKNEEVGWKLTIEAAKLGHPVALAVCFRYGQALTRPSTALLNSIV